MSAWCWHPRLGGVRGRRKKTGDYEYGNTLFRSPERAARAAIYDWLTGCGKYVSNVLDGSPQEMLEELKRAIKDGDWEVPYLDCCSKSLDKLFYETIEDCLNELEGR